MAMMLGQSHSASVPDYSASSNSSPAIAVKTGKWISLVELLATAAMEHPSVAAASAKAGAAAADLSGARWQFYPTPSVSVENARTESTDRSYLGDGTVSIIRLQQPLWTGGRLTAGVDKGEANLRLNQAALAESREQQALRVIQFYGDWLSARLRVEALVKSQSAHQRLRQQVANRLSEGASALSDLTLAESRLKVVDSELQAAQVQLRGALARLGQLYGSPVSDNALAHKIASPRLIRTPLPQLVDMAQDVSPGIRRASEGVQVSTAAISEKRADLSPELFVRAERQHGDHVFATAPPSNRLFVGLSSRFGAGLSNVTAVDSLRKQQEAAQREVDVLKRSLQEQIEVDHAQAAAAESRIAALEAALAASLEVSLSYDRQFLAGRKAWLDVMNAAREVAQTETQLADARSGYLVYTWRLALLTAGLDTLLAERGPL
jgi:adhesin transport system outer membrane protein